MSQVLPNLYPLTAAQIQEVLDDLRLIQDEGALIYFAVDPSEIQDFCFPIDLGSDATANIRTIADDQAALFEVFYRQRPLLLAEYAHEMRGMLNYFEYTVDQLRDRSDMVDRLILEGELVSGDIPEDSAGAQSEFLEKNFGIILAIAMGIFSLGVDRLKQIYYTRLIKNDLGDKIPSDEITVVKRIFDSYQRTDLADLILTHLRRPRSVRDRFSPVSDIVDAWAIDHIIYLNSAFEQAFLEGKLRRRYLVLYLSSAKKTMRLFSSVRAQAFLPRIRGNPFNFWRTRAQIFAYVVHRSRENNIGETISNLQRVKSVLEEIGKFEGIFSSEDCEHCVLVSGSPMVELTATSPCRWLDFCRKVKGLDEEIEKARSEVDNLGLMNTLNDYQRLRSARPQGDSQKQYFKFFKEAFDSPLKRNAQTRMQRLQQWILVKSEFTNRFTEALGVGKSGFDESILRSSKDFVTGLDQYLPTKPKLRSETYMGILDLILAFYKDPTNKSPIVEAYKRYVEIDTETREFDAEHELIRCFLYLALPSNKDFEYAIGGDDKAYKHAETIIEKDDLVDRPDWAQTADWIKQEYRYVQCWAARRTGRFSRAIKLAKEGIAHDDSDPRFFHGLCLSVYSWLAKKPGDCTSDIQEAIATAERALELYLKEGTAGQNDEVVAANYNNLAYFWAWSVELHLNETLEPNSADLIDSEKALLNARSALEHLKSVLPKETWQITKHPEFFHTEAYLEYQESEAASSKGNRVAAREKLKNASREINSAVSLFGEGPGFEEYRALRDEIERKLELLSAD